MWDRTISIHSAGKLFSVTGARVGWAIGPAHLIKALQAFHQYNVWCMYDPLQRALADSLKESKQSKYYGELREFSIDLRNHMVEQILNSKYDFDVWIPEVKREYDSEKGYVSMLIAKGLRRHQPVRFFVQMYHCTLQKGGVSEFCANLARLSHSSSSSIPSPTSQCLLLPLPTT